MNYTTLFYWLVVADNAKDFFRAGCWLFGAIAIIATVVNFIINSENSVDDDARSISRKWIMWSYPFFFLFMSLQVFTPSKKDALLIVAGGQTLNFLTTDKAAKQIPKELTSFVLIELKNIAKEAKVDLGISTQKEKILEEAKNMTSKELLNRIQEDSIFAKIISEK